MSSTIYVSLHKFESGLFFLDMELTLGRHFEVSFNM